MKEGKERGNRAWRNSLGKKREFLVGWTNSFVFFRVFEFWFRFILWILASMTKWTTFFTFNLFFCFLLFIECAKIEGLNEKIEFCVQKIKENLKSLRYLSFIWGNSKQNIWWKIWNVLWKKLEVIFLNDLKKFFGIQKKHQEKHFSLHQREKSNWFYYFHNYYSFKVSKR